MTPEQKIVKLGMELPDGSLPLAEYVPTRRHHDVVYISGQGPIRNGKPVREGKFGAELTLDDARDLAAITTLNILAALRREVRELSRVQAVLNLTGYVASTPDFTSQHLVVDHASKLLKEILGDAGHHARAAVATNVLPLNMPLEISVQIAVGE